MTIYQIGKFIKLSTISNLNDMVLGTKTSDQKHEIYEKRIVVVVVVNVVVVVVFVVVNVFFVVV